VNDGFCANILSTRNLNCWQLRLIKFGLGTSPINKWSHYKLYTVLDIFSRYVVGWMIASLESSELGRNHRQKATYST
jgi:transposase InsO family protein